MRAIDRLRLNRRVPPWIKQENVLSRGQVETQSSCLETDEEERTRRIGLKTLDSGGSIARTAIEVFVRRVQRVEPRPEQRNETRELRKHERFVSLRNDLEEPRN